MSADLWCMDVSIKWARIDGDGCRLIDRDGGDGDEIGVFFDILQ